MTPQSLNQMLSTTSKESVPGSLPIPISEAASQSAFSLEASVSETDLNTRQSKEYPVSGGCSGRTRRIDYIVRFCRGRRFPNEPAVFFVLIGVWDDVVRELRDTRRTGAGRFHWKVCQFKLHNPDGRRFNSLHSKISIRDPSPRRLFSDPRHHGGNTAHHYAHRLRCR